MTKAYGTTTVPVEKSQAEIRGLLTRFGAREFGFGEAIDDLGTPWAAVTFTHHDLRVRLRAPLKLPDPRELDAKARRARTKSRDDLRYELAEQEAKRIWRVMAHNLKARMVAVDEEVETFEEAFLAHIVDPDSGRTIYEQMADTGHAQLPAPLPALMPGPAN